MILLNWFPGSGRSDTLIRLVRNGSKVHLFSGSSVLINLLVHPTEKCRWSLPLYDCPYSHIYLMFGVCVCMCVCTGVCMYTYMCILFEKFVVVAVMVVTFKQHKTVHDKSNLKVVANVPANVGDTRDMGSIPGLGRSPGGGNGNALLENSMWTDEPGGLHSRGRKELDATEHTPTQPHSHHRDTCLQFNTCPCYAFLCRYKHSHICIPSSVS